MAGRVVVRTATASLDLASSSCRFGHPVQRLARQVRPAAGLRRSMTTALAPQDWMMSRSRPKGKPDGPYKSLPRPCKPLSRLDYRFYLWIARRFYQATMPNQQKGPTRAAFNTPNTSTGQPLADLNVDNEPAPAKTLQEEEPQAVRAARQIARAGLFGRGLAAPRLALQTCSPQPSKRIC